MFFGRAFLTSLILFGAEAFAFWCPYAQYPRAIASLADVQPRIIKVEDIGPPDRRTEQQFGAEHHMSSGEVQRRYAATGKLFCGPYVQTADLVGQHDLLVTAGHMFRPGFGTKEPCKIKEQPRDCKFVAQIGSHIISRKVAKEIGAGYDKCPASPAQTDDWAVLKLERPIKEITPYTIDPHHLYKGETVTSVEENSPDFAKVDSQGHRIALKSIGRCVIQNVYSNYGEDVYFSSDCDSTKGNSGSAVLDDDGGVSPVLLGITVNGGESPQDLIRAIRTGHVNHCNYKEGSCTTYHIPVTGNFLDTLKRAGAVNPLTDSSQPGISL